MRCTGTVAVCDEEEVTNERVSSSERVSAQLVTDMSATHKQVHEITCELHNNVAIDLCAASID